MQTAIRTTDICATTPTVILPGNVTLTASVQGCAMVSATINGTIINNVPTPYGLSVTSPLLGGQVVVGGTWTGI